MTGEIVSCSLGLNVGFKSLVENITAKEYCFLAKCGHCFALHNLPAHDGLIAYILISAENILHLIKLGCCKIYNKKCAYRELKFTFIKKLRYQNKIMIF